LSQLVKENSSTKRSAYKEEQYTSKRLRSEESLSDDDDSSSSSSSNEPSTLPIDREAKNKFLLSQFVWSFESEILYVVYQLTGEEPTEINSIFDENWTTERKIGYEKKVYSILKKVFTPEKTRENPNPMSLWPTALKQITNIIKSQHSEVANPKGSTDFEFNADFISKIIQEADITPEQKNYLHRCVPYVFIPDKLEGEVRKGWDVIPFEDKTPSL